VRRRYVKFTIAYSYGDGNFIAFANAYGNGNCNAYSDFERIKLGEMRKRRRNLLV
jgi:hypothetical protein